MSEPIADRVRRVRDAVALAAERSGRRPEEITIVAAAKTFSPAAVSAVLDAGITEIGENYVQEGKAKRAAVGDREGRWHLIGHLQRNKARAALQAFDLIQSVDRASLARALDRAAADLDTRARCLVQVRIGAEPTKDGVAPEDLRQLLDEIASLPRVDVLGLMAVPPVRRDLQASRRDFAHLRKLRDDIGDLRLGETSPKELSMGMSGDFTVAVEEGATIVRIGTALFGERVT